MNATRPEIIIKDGSAEQRWLGKSERVYRMAFGYRHTTGRDAFLRTATAIRRIR